MRTMTMALLMIAGMAEAATWTSPNPTTGCPCVESRWQLYDPSGAILRDVLTDSNYVTLPDFVAPVRLRRACHDEQMRWSPWSEWSDPYFSPPLLDQYQRAGIALRIRPLSMTVGLVMSVEWAEPQ